MNETKDLLEKSMLIKTGDDAIPVFDEEVSVLLRALQDMLVEGAPNIKRQSTDDLRKSIRIEGNRVVIGNEDVNYAVYTNEKWISEKWKGAINPNEGWVDRIVKQALILFASKYGYKVVYD